MIKTIEWKDDAVILLDQTLLPEKEVYLRISDCEAMAEAIRKLRIRGAPAIGVAGALGVYLGVRDLKTEEMAEFQGKLDEVSAIMADTRPTAVNLSWAIRRVRSRVSVSGHLGVEEVKSGILREALDIMEQDRTICREIGRNGEPLIPDGAALLTHCNTGALATVDYGTALGVVFTAVDKGKKVTVFVDETRPLLQGSRLTAYELMKQGIETIVVCDSMSGFLMQQKKIDAVIVGADRIARNGDTANKIGTYTLAVLCRQHGLPFYVAAPTSTVDLDLPDGTSIPIEERNAEEITQGFGKLTAPKGVRTYNPAFDVTPAGMISAIITEKGVVHGPDFRLDEHLRI